MSNQEITIEQARRLTSDLPDSAISALLVKAAYDKAEAQDAIDQARQVIAALRLATIEAVGSRLDRERWQK